MFRGIWNQRYFNRDWLSPGDGGATMTRVSTQDMTHDGVTIVDEKDKSEIFLKESLEMRFGESRSTSLVVSNLEALLRAAASQPLNWNRLEVIRKALSLSLKRNNVAPIVSGLQTLLAEGAIRSVAPMVESFLQLMAIPRTCQVTTVLTLFKPEAMPLDTMRPEYLQFRIEQLEDLYVVNPRLSWRLIIVYEPHDSVSQEAQWLELLRGKYPTYEHSRQVQIIRLPPGHPETFKGAGIVYGMHKALEEGADYVIYGDAKPAVDWGQEGVVLAPVVSNSDSIVIGSRYAESKYVSRDFKRQIMSKIYNRMISVLLPSLAGLKDTQCPLKCFSNSRLEFHGHARG
jgi:hypothetical protein